MRNWADALYRDLTHRSLIEGHVLLCRRSAELRQKSQDLRKVSTQLRQDIAVRYEMLAALVAKRSQY